MTELDDAHYIRSVTSLGDTREVVTSHAIFSESGIKLVSVGVRINSASYERLVRHKLMSPLEQCLTVENAVDNAAIVQAAELLVQQEPQLAHMLQALPEIAMLWRALKVVPLNQPLAFKLTLAREQRPRLFSHSVTVALISIYLGIRLNMTPRELIDLAAAGLFHDIGELHLSPSLFESNRPLTPTERRHIYAHPLIGHMVLQAFPEYHPEISGAVLQHHERMDGSGYPHGVRGEQIGLLGQILALAEVAGSKIGQSAPDWVRLEMMLKLNSYQFGPGLIGHLAVLYPHDMNVFDAAAQASVQHIHEHIDKIASAFDLAQRLLPATAQSTATLIQQRLSSLRVAMLDAGVNPADKHSATHGIEQDGRSLVELDHLTQETLWQLRELLFDIKRRWAGYATDSSPAGQALSIWIVEMARLFQVEQAVPA